MKGFHLGRSALTLPASIAATTSQRACCTWLLRTGATCFSGCACLRKSVDALSCTMTSWVAELRLVRNSASVYECFDAKFLYKLGPKNKLPSWLGETQSCRGDINSLAKHHVYAYMSGHCVCAP